MTTATHLGVPPLARGAVLIALVVLAYIPALRAGFVWDDVQTYILENPLIHQADGLRRIWTTGEPMDFYPLTFTTWWIEWRLWGRNAAGFHALNIVLHATSALLVWRLLVRLRVPAAWLAALLWALHPVNVESVAWISQRKNVLSGVFFFAALLACLRWNAGGGARGGAAALGLFLLALLGKSSTVVLPCVLLILVWLERGRIGRADLVRALPFFALSLAFGLVTLSFQGRLLANAVVEVRDASAVQRGLDAGWAVWFYLYKALLPVRLSVVYPYAAAPAGAAGIAGVVGVVALFALLWTRRATPGGRAALAAFAWFVVTLLPVLGFVDIGFMQYAVVADHWQYLSILAPIALGVGFVVHRWRRDTAPARKLRIGVAAAAVIVLGGLTWRQCGIYRDEESLWRDTLRKNPRIWVAHNNLAKDLLARGRASEAVPHLEQVLRDQPDNLAARLNLASAQAQLGDLAAAAAAFEAAVRLEPRYAPAHYNLGHVRFLQGNATAAARHFAAALDLDPSHAAAHLGLGNACVQLDRKAEAEREFEAFIALRPSSPDGYYNLGLLQLQRGDLEGAKRQMQTAARLGDAQARSKLDELQARQPSGGR